MEHEAHTELLQHLRYEVELAHRDAAGKYQHVVRAEVEAEPLGDLRFVIAHVIVGDARESMLPQRGGDAVGIRAAHLVWLDDFTGLDQLIAGGDHDDHWLGADSQARHAGAGGDRHFGRGQARAGG